MTSDSGLISQDSDYPKAIQEVLDELHELQQTPRLVTNPDALETLEREIRQCTDHLGSLLVGYHMQQALDSAVLQAEQAQLVSQWPKPLKNDGKVQVRVRPAEGPAASGQAFRRGVCGPDAVRDIRSLHPGVGFRGESVRGDVGLTGRGSGRAGRPGRGAGYQNGADDCLPLCGPRQAGATDRAHGV